MFVGVLDPPLSWARTLSRSPGRDASHCLVSGARRGFNCGNFPLAVAGTASYSHAKPAVTVAIIKCFGALE